MSLAFGLEKREEEGGRFQGESLANLIFTPGLKLGIFLTSNWDTHSVNRLQKIFDTEDHKDIFRHLKNQGIPVGYLRILQEMYEDLKARIINNGTCSRSASSVPKEIYRELKWEGKGINSNGTRITNLKFADDVIFLAASQEQLKEMLNKL